MNFSDRPWSLLHKIAFRFFATYLALYMFPAPLSFIPGIGFVFEYYQSLWDLIVPAVGKHVLHLGHAVSLQPSGSGDKTYDYVFLFCILLLSVFITLVWSLADLKRSHYAKLEFWLRIWARYYLGIFMILYGFAKIFKSQFPFPSLDRLLEPYGDSSPMGLVWTFMGYSPAYNLFTGLGEAIGGLLLFFRRTTTIGALLIIVVMSNVVMINFSYDVPVKLFSSHLLFIAFLLLLPDAQRLVNFFILNRATAPADHRFMLEDKKFNQGRAILKVILIGLLLYSNISSGYEAERKWGDKREKPPLYGIYNVETFVVNGDTVPPLTGDSVRWQQVVVDWDTFLSIRRMNGQKDRYNSSIDSSQMKLNLTPQTRAKDTYYLHFEAADSLLVLDGITAGQDSLKILLKKRDLNSFLLINRGYHWINETPFNR